jgi:hypothetical protein
VKYYTEKLSFIVFICTMGAVVEITASASDAVTVATNSLALSLLRIKTGRVESIASIAFALYCAKKYFNAWQRLVIAGRKFFSAANFSPSVVASGLSEGGTGRDFSCSDYFGISVPASPNLDDDDLVPDEFLYVDSQISSEVAGALNDRADFDDLNLCETVDPDVNIGIGDSNSGTSGPVDDEKYFNAENLDVSLSLEDVAAVLGDQEFCKDFNPTPVSSPGGERYRRSHSLDFTSFAFPDDHHSLSCEDVSRSVRPVIILKARKQKRKRKPFTEKYNNVSTECKKLVAQWHQNNPVSSDKSAQMSLSSTVVFDEKLVQKAYSDLYNAVTLKGPFRQEVFIRCLKICNPVLKFFRKSQASLLQRAIFARQSYRETTAKFIQRVKYMGKEHERQAVDILNDLINRFNRDGKEKERRNFLLLNHIYKALKDLVDVSDSLGLDSLGYSNASTDSLIVPVVDSNLSVEAAAKRVVLEEQSSGPLTTLELANKILRRVINKTNVSAEAGHLLFEQYSPQCDPFSLSVRRATLLESSRRATLLESSVLKQSKRYVQTTGLLLAKIKMMGQDAQKKAIKILQEIKKCPKYNDLQKNRIKQALNDLRGGSKIFLKNRSSKPSSLLVRASVGGAESGDGAGEKVRVDVTPDVAPAVAIAELASVSSADTAAVAVPVKRKAAHMTSGQLFSIGQKK